MQGLLLKHQLELNGVKLGEFAEQIGWNQTKLSNLVQGRRVPRTGEIKKILATLRRLKIKIDKHELFPEIKEISELC